MVPSRPPREWRIEPAAPAWPPPLPRAANDVELDDGQALLRYEEGRLTADYCDVFLTHDSTSGTHALLTAVRKAHNCGRNHLQNVRDYYAAMAPADMQAMLDNIRREYEKRGLPPPIELVAPHVAYRLPPPSLMPNGT